jgi:ABC-type uncharacterized transport system involved in gliding motility auxiliary subunit
MGLTAPAAGRRAIAARLLGTLGLVLLLVVAVTFFFGVVEFTLGTAALALACLAGWLLLSEAGSARRFFQGRAAHFGLFTALSALLLAVLLGAANYAAIRHPRTWDLTRGRIFTLSEDTVRTLRGLPIDVQALAFYGQADAAWPAVSDLLRRCAAVSPRFTWQMVDPYKSPEAVKRYAITEGGPRVVLLAGTSEGRAKSPDEEGLTNALVRLTRSGSRVAYFTTGHGEPDPRDEGERGYALAVRSLEAEGVEVRPLALVEKPEVPADAAVVVVGAPRKAFLAPEREALRRYAAAGGHLGLFLEPEVRAGLDPLLSDLGVALDDDMVVDPSPVAQLFSGSPVTPIVLPQAGHPVTRGMGQGQLRVALPTVRSVRALERAGDGDGAGPAPVPLLLTGREAWGETDIAGLFSKGAQLDPGDRPGPLAVALAVARPAAAAEGRRSAETRAVVVGDGEFFANQYLQLLGNQDLFQNAVSWLAEQEDRITIRPRSREASRLFLSQAQVSSLKFLTILVLPMSLLAVGLGVWLVRRSR